MENNVEKWITQKEKEQQRMYRNNLLLMKGKHYEVFEDDVLARLKKSGYEITGGYFSMLSKAGTTVQSNIPVSAMFVSENLLGLATKTYRNFLFGEYPTITTDDTVKNDWIIQLGKDNEMYQKCLSGCNYQSALGFAAYKVRKDESGKVVIDKIDNEYIYFVESEESKGSLEAIDVRYVLDKNTLMIERHRRGNIESLKYKIKDDKIVNLLESNIIETGLDDFAITIVHNEINDELYGDSDYTDTAISLQKEIDVRLTQTAMSLDKTQNPPMQVPKSLMRIDPQTNEEYIDIIGKAVLADNDDKDIKYVEYNGNYDTVEAIVQNRSKSLMSELSVVYALVDTERLGNASGTALKVKLMPTLQIINMKKNQWEIGLNKIYTNAYKLQTGGDIGDITFKWYNGIPLDRTEEARISQIRTGGKSTQSQTAAIMELDNKTKEQAELELSVILEEDKLSGTNIIPNF